MFFLSDAPNLRPKRRSASSAKHTEHACACAATCAGLDFSSQHAACKHACPSTSDTRHVTPPTPTRTAAQAAPPVVADK